MVDYKTGGGNQKANLDGGKQLQLPLYLFAGEAISGEPLASGSAEYLYASRRGGFKRVRMEGQELAGRLDDLRLILGRIASGIRTGDFHPVPSQRNCRWCDFDPVCHVARERIAERKQDDERAASFRALGEIE